MKALRDTRHMTVRHLMALWRQPWWIAVSLVQPVIWLLLFGALFKSVTDIPGSMIHVSGLPEAPEGMMISSVEVIVRLRNADGEEVTTAKRVAGHHA